jgi:hypothetical protein
LRWGLASFFFFPRLTLNVDPPQFILPNS